MLYPSAIKDLQKAETQAFIKRINEPLFTSADIPLTTRIINHWHLKGVFPFQKERGKHLDYSMVDFMWVLFAKRLRNLGVALPNIIQIKEQCFASIMPLFSQVIAQLIQHHEPGELTGNLKQGANIIKDAGGLANLKEELEAKEFRLFSLWLMVAIKNNQDVLVRIQPDAANTTDFVVLTKEATDTQQIVQTIAQKGGLFISMKALLNEFYGSEQFNWENIQKLEIDDEAKLVIGIIREKGIKEVTLQMREGKVKHAKTKLKEKRVNPIELQNSMNAKTYAEWRVVKQEGDQLIVGVTENHKLRWTKR